MPCIVMLFGSTKPASHLGQPEVQNLHFRRRTCGWSAYQQILGLEIPVQHAGRVRRLHAVQHLIQQSGGERRRQRAGAIELSAPRHAAHVSSVTRYAVSPAMPKS